MNSEISDHYPMMITFQDPQLSDTVSFKFFNVWIEHASCMPLIETEWKRSHRHGNIKELWLKLKTLRLVLKHLNNIEFKCISCKIEKAKNDLNRI